MKITPGGGCVFGADLVFGVGFEGLIPSGPVKCASRRSAHLCAVVLLRGRPMLTMRSACRVASVSSLTAWQLEASNPSLPASSAGRLSSGCVVLVDVPERAIIHGVNIHRGVVAPARVRS